ncbi:MAG: transglycosylase SLT domain-containing protein [Bryobacteraceae bacterium]
MKTLPCLVPIIRARWFRLTAALIAAAVCVLLFGPRPADGAASKTAKSKTKSKKKTSTTAKKTTASTRKTNTASKKVVPPPPLAVPVDVSATPLQAMVRKLRATPNAPNRAALAAYASAQKNQNGALAYLALGIADTESKQFAGAPASLRAAQARLPVLADYVAYWTADAALEGGDPAAALKAIEPIWTVAPDSPLLGNAALVAAKANLAYGNPAAAIAILKSFSPRLPQPKGEALLASCYEAAHDPQAAALSWQRVYYEYPNAFDAAQASTALKRLRTELGASFPVPSSRQILSRIDLILAGKRYAAAREELEETLPAMPAAERDVARVRIGAATFLGGDSLSALRYLKSVDVKDKEADAERLFYIASCYRRTDNDNDFNHAMDQLNKHGKSPWRLKALVMAGNRYQMQNEPEKYERYYKAGAENFPDAADGMYCDWKVTWLHYIQRRGNADEMLRHHLKAFPATDKGGAALYFLGRLAETHNKPAAARTYFSEVPARYPNAYYAMLAKQRLGVLANAGSDTGVAKFLSEVEWPARNQNLAFEMTPLAKHRLDRARLLVTAGLDDLAESELRYGAKNEGPAPLLAMELATLATRRGSPDQGIRFIKGLVPDYLYLTVESAPAAFWRLAFPIPYRAKLEESAKEFDLDPYSVAALVRQESEFNARVVSYAGAYGLAQVMPATGRSLSKRVGIPRFTTSLLYDPGINLRLGSYFLRSLLNSFSGKWEPVLASYNAGKSRADNWLTWADYKEPAEFIESIPITQTREYVQIVLRNADLYRRLYATPTLAADNGH